MEDTKQIQSQLRPFHNLASFVYNIFVLILNYKTRFCFPFRFQGPPVTTWQAMVAPGNIPYATYDATQRASYPYSPQLCHAEAKANGKSCFNVK